jgi:hypothetical protein
LAVSPGVGPVETVVQVRVTAPVNDGCGIVAFEQSPPGPSAQPFANVGRVAMGSSNFLFTIPSFLRDAAPGPVGQVSPGGYVFTLTCDMTNNPATALTVNVPFQVTPFAPAQSRFVGMAATPDGKGYWLVQAGGGVFSYGDAAFEGSLPGRSIVPNAPVVGMAVTPDGRGYWLVGADGGVFGFGDAVFRGSLPGSGVVPNDRIVGIGGTSTGRGYWLVGADGGVFAFGDAVFRGSAPVELPSPCGPFVGLSPIAGGSYVIGSSLCGWSAVFGAGPPVPITFNIPLGQMVGMAVTTTGGGLWAVSSDGGVFTASTAYPATSTPAFYGSLPGRGIVPNAPIVGIVQSPDDHGYWLVAADGGVFSFGDAPFYGSAAAVPALGSLAPR